MKTVNVGSDIIKTIKDENKKKREIDNVGKKAEDVGRKVDKVADKINDLRKNLRAYMDERFKKLKRKLFAFSHTPCLSIFS